MARAFLALAVLALVTAGCASDDDSDTQSTSETSSTTGDGTTVSVSGSVSVSTSSTGAPPNGVAKTIEDDRYPDGNFTLEVGQSATWTNMGQNPHSVTSDIGLFDSSPGCTATTPDACMANGETFTHRFDAPGTYAYHCNVHPTTMSGTITVVQG